MEINYNVTSIDQLYFTEATLLRRKWATLLAFTVTRGLLVAAIASLAAMVTFSSKFSAGEGLSKTAHWTYGLDWAESLAIPAILLGGWWWLVGLFNRPWLSFAAAILRRRPLSGVAAGLVGARRLPVGKWRLEIKDTQVLADVDGQVAAIPRQLAGEVRSHPHGIVISLRAPMRRFPLYVPMRAFATEAEMESFVAALSASAAGVCGVADAASSGPQQTPQGGITIRFARTVYDLQTAMRAKLVNDRRLVANTLALPCMVPLLLLIAAVPLSPAALGLLAAWAVFWGVFFVIRGEAGAALWWWRYRKVRSARRSQDASRTLCAVFAVRINSQGLHISIPESGCGLRIPWHKIKGLTTDAGGIALNHNDDLTGEPIFLPVRAFEGRGDMEAAAAFMWSCILTDGRTSGGKNLGRWSNLATSGE